MAQRVWTALVAMTLILGSLLWPAKWPFVLVAFLALFLGGEELAKLLNWGWKSRVAAAIYSFAFASACWIASGYGPVVMIGMQALIFGIGCLSLFFRNTEKPHPLAWLGMGWLSAPIFCLITTHLWGSSGPNPAALIFLSLWVGDTLALLTGKGIGKHLLAPKLSPSKTWEGAIGGIIGSILSAAGFGIAYEVPWPAAITIGALCGVLGLLGDLFESFLKRRMEVKDSGGLLPGHGGMLDRIDSMLMASIPAAALLMASTPALFVFEHWSGLLR